MTTNTPKKQRTITMTNRRPVTIVDADWPEIACATEENGTFGPGMTPRPREEVARTTLCAREHADKRLLVYVTTFDASQWGHHTKGHDGGTLFFVPGTDPAIAIREVGQTCQVSESLIRDCIASLSAEEI